MSRRLVGILALAAVLGLTTLVGAAFQGALAQERDEAERVEREQERLDRERERAERRADVQRARALTLLRPFAAGGQLGVHIADVDEETVRRLGLPEERGARVAEVIEDTPAAEAGIREDDVIVRWNDQGVESVAQLRRHVMETPAGRDVRLGVIRDGSERTVTVQLAERAGPRAMMRAPRAGMDADRMRDMRVRLRDAERQMERAHLMMTGRARLGVGIQSLTPQLAEHFGVEPGTGALVTTVREGSPAERAGLRAGDVIVSVAGESVERPGDILRALRDREPGPVALRVVRDRQERTLTVELEEREEGEGTSFFFSPDGAFEVGPFRMEGFRTDPIQLEFEAIEWPELGIERFEIPSVEIPAFEFPGIDLPSIQVPLPVAPRPGEVTI